MDAIAEIHSELPILSDMPDTTEMPETLEVLPIAELKRKPGRPAGSKNKTVTQKVTKEEVEKPCTPPPHGKRPRTPSPDPAAPKHHPRPAKKRSRTRVVILSSSESEEAPPLVRVVRKPRAVKVVSSSSEDEAPPARPMAAAPVHFEADIRANHQQHLAARRKTYDAYFQHLK